VMYLGVIAAGAGRGFSDLDDQSAIAATRRARTIVLEAVVARQLEIEVTRRSVGARRAKHSRGVLFGEERESAEEIATRALRG